MRMTSKFYNKNTGAHLLCLGGGYVAQSLGRSLIPQGWKVTFTHRPSTLQSTSFPASETHIAYDEVTPLPESLCASITHLLISLPGSVSKLTKLGKTFPTLKWLGYLSSTGVYGNSFGEWVDESSPLLANDETALARIKAEQFWQQWGEEHHVPVCVLRLSAIYGPGRSVFDQLEKGTAKRIFASGQVFSRIHIEDIVRTLETILAQPEAGGVFNLADDFPCSQNLLIEYACHLLGQPVPPLIPLRDASLSDFGRRFYQSSRRVSNAKLKAALGIRMKYPNFREGLRAMFEKNK